MLTASNDSGSDHGALPGRRSDTLGSIVVMRIVRQRARTYSFDAMSQPIRPSCGFGSQAHPPECKARNGADRSREREQVQESLQQGSVTSRRKRHHPDEREARRSYRAQCADSDRAGPASTLPQEQERPANAESCQVTARDTPECNNRRCVVVEARSAESDEQCSCDRRK
jgi:hypothetical protein